MLEIMKEYGWDWYTYMRQPNWVLELAVQKMSIESKLAEQESARMKPAEHA